MIYARDIYVEYLGKDHFDRKLYKDTKNGNVYVDIDYCEKYDFNTLYTISPDGEPDCPLRDDIRVIRLNEETNKLIADKIANIIIENDYGHDSAIYFNNMCYRLNNNEIQLIPNQRPSDCFEYANNATVSMTFEGSLYRSINGYDNYGYPNIFGEIDSIANEYGYYFELGNAWNMAMYKI